MGAIGGILIVDYWVIRKQQLMADDLFRVQGAYTYRSGFNPCAVIALVVAILPVVPGFVRAATTPGGAIANPNFADQLYSYAWFVTFALSAIIYYALMRGTRADHAAHASTPQ